MKDTRRKSHAARRPNFELTAEERGFLIKQCEKDITSAGRTQYLRFLHGEKLTHREAILAKCYDCDGGHSDGRYDCEVPSCSLRLFMPYKGKFAPESSNP